METNPPPGHQPPIFTLSRSFDAPRDLVWKAFSDGAQLAQWWGPKDLEWVTGDLDFRAGGTFHYAMRVPNGPVMWGKFAYREIIPKERITWVNSFSDENGGVK